MSSACFVVVMVLSSCASWNSKVDLQCLWAERENGEVPRRMRVNMVEQRLDGKRLDFRANFLASGFGFGHSRFGARSLRILQRQLCAVHRDPRLRQLKARRCAQFNLLLQKPRHFPLRGCLFLQRGFRLSPRSKD